MEWLERFWALLRVIRSALQLVAPLAVKLCHFGFLSAGKNGPTVLAVDLQVVLGEHQQAQQTVEHATQDQGVARGAFLANRAAALTRGIRLHTEDPDIPVASRPLRAESP